MREKLYVWQCGYRDRMWEELREKKYDKNRLHENLNNKNLKNF